jgi:hypothetical protein
MQRDNGGGAITLEMPLASFDNSQTDSALWRGTYKSRFRDAPPVSCDILRLGAWDGISKESVISKVTRW